MDFVSENTAPVHPAFMEAVVKANDGFALNLTALGQTEMFWGPAPNFRFCLQNRTKAAERGHQSSRTNSPQIKSALDPHFSVTPSR